MSKKNICVIFGGVSSEHEVSKLSAKTVLSNIDYDKFNVFPVFITKDGSWKFFEGSIDDVASKNPEDFAKNDAIISPDRADKCLIKFSKDGSFEKIHIDAAFPVLHGKFGEDGTIQGLFSLAGIPYAGSGVVGSGVCMDKCMAKILFQKEGINQARWVEVKKGDKLNTKLVEETLGYPVFVKPSAAGSSVGVTKASNETELKAAVDLAFEHDYKVLIEEAINAREVEISLMGNLMPKCSPYAGEILPAKEFYDFEAKYEDESSKLLLPAPIDDDTLRHIKDCAVRAYRICECRGFARVDFFVEKNTGEVFLNEINTLPGFTEISMYPKLWSLADLSIKDLITKIIDLAIERND